MIITSYRRKGDGRIVLNGDDGHAYHLQHAETAANWMLTNTTNLPTLASISPTTAVAGAANTTVTLTGTNFNTTYSEVLVNGSVHPRTFVSATSMTIVLPTSTVVGAQVWQIAVRNQGVFVTASRPFTYTAA